MSPLESRNPSAVTQLTFMIIPFGMRGKRTFIWPSRRNSSSGRGIVVERIGLDVISGPFCVVLLDSVISVDKRGVEFSVLVVCIALSAVVRGFKVVWLLVESRYSVVRPVVEDGTGESELVFEVDVPEAGVGVSVPESGVVAIGSEY